MRPLANGRAVDSHSRDQIMLDAFELFIALIYMCVYSFTC